MREIERDAIRAMKGWNRIVIFSRVASPSLAAALVFVSQVNWYFRDYVMGIIGVIGLAINLQQTYLSWFKWKLIKVPKFDS